MALAGDRKFREIFFAFNGAGPYSCYDCGKDVDFWTVLIHHENHDHSDNRLENLVPSHRGCHTRHHSIGRGIGKSPSKETREKMRQSGLKRWSNMSEEERKINGKKSFDGRNDDRSETMKKSWETRRKNKAL